MIRAVIVNPNPPLSDDNTDTLFDDIYLQLEWLPDDDMKEKLAVWIADRVQQSYCDGHEQGCVDSLEALRNGMLT